MGGRINVSENCIDRHLSGPRRNKAAIIFEGEPGEKRTLTYQQLYREVCRFANVLKRNHVKKGDCVLIYMPMIPEAAIAMLACTRIGAVHTVVFGGFSAESIKDRLADSGATAVITADGGYRRGAIVPLKNTVDAALKGEHSVKRVIVFRRACNDIHIEPGATSGGIARWSMWMPRAPLPRSIPSTPSSSCTRAAPPGNPKAFSTRRAAT